MSIIVIYDCTVCIESRYVSVVAIVVCYINFYRMFFLFFFFLMMRRPPGSTQSRSSAASDVYKRQQVRRLECRHANTFKCPYLAALSHTCSLIGHPLPQAHCSICLLYTAPSPRERTRYRMPYSAWKKKNISSIQTRDSSDTNEKRKTPKTSEPNLTSIKFQVHSAFAPHVHIQYDCESCNYERIQ